MLCMRATNGRPYDQQSDMPNKQCGNWKGSFLRKGSPKGKRRTTVRLFLVGEVTDAMSELFFIDSISSEVGMVIGESSKVRDTSK